MANLIRHGSHLLMQRIAIPYSLFPIPCSRLDAARSWGKPP
ncbi:hypothetical protein [Moorena sp. SIOASIH]|nr:hypothetical protein [Moorena sp. SIOASIH]